MKLKIKKWIIRISVILNIIFILSLLWNYLNSASYKLGRLEENISIGFFTTDSVLFTLPRGLTVRDVSSSGINAIGQFENNRFEIIITSGKASIVNYSLPKDSLDIFGNYYSADVLKYSE